MPRARSTALCATTPNASTARRSAIAASSAAKKPLQVRISAGVGRLAGGTQRTAFTIRTPGSTSPSSGAAA